MNIVFFGTPEFAIPSLDILIKNHFHVAAVVTAPDTPSGRGQKLQASAVKKYSLSKGLKVFQPVKLKDEEFLKELSILKPDLQVVVAFRMLPPIIWQAAPLGTFNLHASLLPQYRGAAPIHWVLINGEPETGLTTFFINENIDTGKILFSVKLPISPEESAGELHDRMMYMGAELTLKTVTAIVNKTIIPQSQEEAPADKSLLKPAPKIQKADCFVPWSSESTRVYNLIRGLSPFPGACSWLISTGGVKYFIKIFRCRPEPGISFSNPGDIQTDSKTYLKVSVVDGFIEILELQAEGRKKLSVELFLRGFPINNHWKFVENAK